jgi:MFS family permease
MFERFKRNSDTGDGYDDRGAVATADRPVDRDDPRYTDDPRYADNGGATGAVTTRETMRDVRARQRDEYGGTNWGAAFFGWLVAIGVAVILLAILSAAGTAFGLGENVSTSDARANADTIGVVGGILLIAVLAIAYYCGGYVSGRMSRFDGGRQGFGTWAIGLIVTIVLAVAGWVFGSEYNVLEQLNLPRIPIDEGSLTAGAAIALAAAVILSLLAAMGGGKAGERYHRKIDRFAVAD